MKLPALTWKRALFAVVLLLVLSALGFIIWASTTNPIMPQAQVALNAGDGLDVVTDGNIIFEPSAYNQAVGFVLYPGGRVQAGAYAPLARAIADEGYVSAIVTVPLNLAFFNLDAAQSVIDAYPQISTWVVAGHSLGGVAAASFAESHPDTVRGLVLMASYPANDALAQRDNLQVISLYATQDGLASPQTVLDSAPNLPPDTQFIEITGGNHAQFGYYGEQGGDNPAEISRDEQQAQVLDAILNLMQSLE